MSFFSNVLTLNCLLKHKYIYLYSTQNVVYKFQKSQIEGIETDLRMLISEAPSVTHRILVHLWEK